MTIDIRPYLRDIAIALNLLAFEGGVALVAWGIGHLR